MDLSETEKFNSTSIERQKRSQNVAPVLVIISGNSLVYSGKIITSTGFYRCCTPGASAPVVVKNQSPNLVSQTPRPRGRGRPFLLRVSQVFLNNIRWVPDSCHREEGKSSRELFEKVCINSSPEPEASQTQNSLFLSSEVNSCNPSKILAQKEINMDPESP